MGKWVYPCNVRPYDLSVKVCPVWSGTVTKPVAVTDYMSAPLPTPPAVASLCKTARFRASVTGKNTQFNWKTAKILAGGRCPPAPPAGGGRNPPLDPPQGGLVGGYLGAGAAPRSQVP